MFLQEEIAGRMQVSIMSVVYNFVGFCVMVCTCCLVCHGVYLLAFVSRLIEESTSLSLSIPEFSSPVKFVFNC